MGDKHRSKFRKKGKRSTRNNMLLARQALANRLVTIADNTAPATPTQVVAATDTHVQTAPATPTQVVAATDTHVQ